MTRLRWHAVCIDCRDARELAGFYVRLLGWEIVRGDGDWFKVAGADGGMELNIQGEEWYQPPAWPERPGEQAKMMHFEIQVDDVDAAVAHAVAAGASEASTQPEGRDRSTLRVMLDPAGHPFCLWSE